MDAKQTALENAMRKIEKDFGKGAIMRLGDIADKMNMEVISSGSLAVDLAVGVGGYPRGRVIEIYGPESSLPGRRPGCRRRRLSPRPRHRNLRPRIVW